MKEGSPQPLLQSHSGDLQAVVPEPKSVGSNLAQNQGIHQVHGLAPQQLSTFPGSAWSETWQARSSRPLEHASQSAAHDVPPIPTSLPTANEDLGRSEQPSVHGLGSQQLSTFPRSAWSETWQDLLSMRAKAQLTMFHQSQDLLLPPTRT